MNDFRGTFLKNVDELDEGGKFSVKM